MKLFWPSSTDFEQVLLQLNETTVSPPFSEDVIAFTQNLSKRFIRIRSSPEIVALGYWLRKANVKKLETDFMNQMDGNVIRARGTVFHIAPSNVDTIFVYSWILSLLAGNRNIIRISSKEQKGLNQLMQIIVEELSNPQFGKIAEQTIICTYDHSEKNTVRLSEICHTRVIWGGDTTVHTIRQTPLAPMANELTFPDRFSVAAIKGSSIEQLGDKELDQLVEQFYNDVFWFDQMACSSPRTVIWTGENMESVKLRFWDAFEKKVQTKHYELVAATQVLKYTTSLQLATNDLVQQITTVPTFSRVQLDKLSLSMREQHCGGGLFYEIDVEKLEQASTFIVDKDQTLAYFGFTKDELINFTQQIKTRGIDRIVPIGQALNFDGTWDGQNFLTSFTRKVIIV